METPAFIKHFPFMIKVSSFLDISTGKLTYPLVILRFLGNFVLMAATILCMFDNQEQTNPLSQVHHVLIALMFIFSDTLFSWNRTDVTSLIRFFTSPLSLTNSLYDKVTQNYLNNIRKYSFIFSAQIILGASMWISILIYLLINFPDSTANSYIRLPLGWTPRIFTSYVYVLAAYVFSMSICIWDLASIFPCYITLLCIVMKIKYKVGILCCNLNSLEDRAVSRCKEELARLVSIGRVPLCKKCLRSSRSLIFHNDITFKATTNSVFWRSGQSVPRHCCKVTTKEAIYQATIHDYLKEAIDQHIEIIDLVHLLDKTFSLLLVIYNQLGVIIPVLAIPKIGSVINKTTAEYVYRGIEVLACMVFFTIFNYFGQIILDESDNLRRAIYNCKWTNKPKSFCRSLLIMQTVANRPLRLRTGGIQTLSLQNYRKILSAAYSYTSVLQSMKND